MNQTLSYANFILPASVLTRRDLAHLIREFEHIDAELTNIEVRTTAGAQTPPRPVASEQLVEFLTTNHLDSASAPVRAAILTQLAQLKDHIPIVHLTFAAPADRDSLQQITAWLRNSVHPQTIVTVGVQPGLIAGVYIRTPNHVHDLSLRTKLHNARQVLTRELEALRGAR